MKNYILDSDINFYEELKKPLDVSTSNDDNKCLITNEELEDNHVVLECNHKFNYLPIYLDILKNKTKNSYNMFSTTEYYITCPYCRNKQKKTIPYYEGIVGVDKIVGVNCSKKSFNYVKKDDTHEKCIEILKYGKRKGLQCNAKCKDKISIKMCTRHYKMYEKSIESESLHP